MRASRLLSLLMLLQTHGQMSAPELARALEVSVRTVYRDIEALSAAGVPVYADRGPNGGYQLVAGYRTRLTGLTEGEARSLFFAGLPEAAAELGLGSVLAAAQLKVLAALPPELRERAEGIRQRFHLDVPGWFRDIEQPEHLLDVADAVWNEQAIMVCYQRWGQQVVERELDPLGLVLKAGVWYLAARVREGDLAASAARVREGDLAASAVRTYRVRRIRTLTVLDEAVQRPSGFDLPQYWRRWSQEFRERLYRAEVRVRMSPWAQEMLGYYLGRAAAEAAQATGGPADEDGWREARLPVESLRHAVGELLRFGTSLEVLEPAELRARLASVTAELAATYAAEEQAATGEATAHTPDR